MESYGMESDTEPGSSAMKGSPNTITRNEVSAFNMENQIIRDGTWKQGTDTPLEDSDYVNTNNGDN